MSAWIIQEIIAGTVGKANTFGTCVGRVKSGPMTYARFSTSDHEGVIAGYVGEGRFTDDPLETFGGAGVVEIPQLQQLLRYICENGFEHHVAANFSEVAGASTKPPTSTWAGTCTGTRAERAVACWMPGDPKRKSPSKGRGFSLCSLPSGAICDTRCGR